LIRVLEYVGGGDAEHRIALLLKSLRALLVTFRAVAHVVRDAIDFDHELGGGIVEVGAVCPDRVLLAERDALRAAFEALPEKYFREAHLAPGAASFVHLRAAERRRMPPSTMLRMVPLPVPGRI
jgi:hypothetical protein